MPPNNNMFSSYAVCLFHHFKIFAYLEKLRYRTVGNIRKSGMLAPLGYPLTAENGQTTLKED